MENAVIELPVDVILAKSAVTLFERIGAAAAYYSSATGRWRNRCELTWRVNE
jgi:hypothetical protein